MMNDPETVSQLFMSTLTDLKHGVNKLNDKMDTVVVDVASLKAQTPFNNSKFNSLEERIGQVEDLSGNLKEKTNVIYVVSGLIAAFVTFIVSNFKSFINWNM